MIHRFLPTFTVRPWLQPRQCWMPPKSSWAEKSSRSTPQPSPQQGESLIGNLPPDPGGNIGPLFFWIFLKRDWGIIVEPTPRNLLWFKTWFLEKSWKFKSIFSGWISWYFLKAYCQKWGGMSPGMSLKIRYVMKATQHVFRLANREVRRPCWVSHNLEPIFPEVPVSDSYLSS